MAKKTPTVVDPRSRIVKIDKVRAEDIAPHPGNWRDHPEAQADAIAGVMREVGDVGVLLAWHSERNGGRLTLIDGHLRRGIAPGHEYHVAITDLTDAEADYVLATHDPLANMAIPDAAALDALLTSINTSEAGVQKMLADLAKDAGVGFTPEQTDAESHIDKAEELNEIWKISIGDLWQIGNHRLLCGDSTSDKDVALLLQNEKPHLCVTDPPYGVNYDATWRREIKSPVGKNYSGYSEGKVNNDNETNWKRAWELFPGDVIYAWHPPGKDSIVHGLALQEAGFRLRMQIIWTKNQAVLSRGDYQLKHEPCWYAVREGKPSLITDDRTQNTVWQIDKPVKNETGHSTQKPIECMARPIRNHKADSIYEPFAGSGTTFVACQNLGRRCFGIEISPAYCAVILQRMSDAFPGIDIRKI